MTFEELFKQYVKEKPENISPEPWTIEITQNLSKPPLYNVLGEIIIKLAKLRSDIN